MIESMTAPGWACLVFAIGAFVSLAGAVATGIVSAIRKSDAWVVSCLMFVITLVACYVGPWFPLPAIIAIGAMAACALGWIVAFLVMTRKGG